MIPRYVPQLNEESCDGGRNSRVMSLQNIISKKDFTTPFFKKQAFSPSFP
jgi:hypothetical protein